MNNSSSYTELYNWSITDPTSFWQGQAEAIHWHAPFHTVKGFTLSFAKQVLSGRMDSVITTIKHNERLI